MTTMACPACAAGDAALDVAAAAPKDATHVLVLPGIHCAACIRGVESTLAAQAGVKGARVNLSLKRATVDAAPWVTAETLQDALAAAGFEAHILDADTSATHDTTGRGLILRIGVAGFAMMNVMLLSVAVWSGATDVTRDLFHWISAMIALPAAMFSAQPFFQSAWGALSARRLNMDVPISLAILLASAMSLFETLVGGQHAYFDAALSLTFFLLVGRYLEHRTRSVARSAAADLAALEPSRVHLVRGDTLVEMPLSAVQIDDLIEVKPGARVSVDGVVTKGEAQIDRSALTGESDPVSIKPGAALAAGEIVLDAPVRLRATAVGEDTTLRKMARLVEMAEAARGRYVGLADRAAEIYAPAVHILALLAFLGWSFGTGDLRFAMNVAIATLIITCPCALGLAVPAVATAATGRLYRLGFLVKSQTALERLSEIDTVVFDKTGTLTETRITVPDDLGQDQRDLLYSLAQVSDHPVSKAVAAALEGCETMPLEHVEEIKGAGTSAGWAGQHVFLGRGREGQCEFRTGDLCVELPRVECLRPGAKTAVAAFQNLGMRVELLTGDSAARGEAVAQDLGLAFVRSGVTPEEKAQHIRALADQGQRVLMVGDGLNDAAALAAAHASIAPASALDASRAAADVVLLERGLGGLPDAVRIARKSRRRILENFAIAAGYNAIAIPVALSGFATPLLAALAMSSSSITVLLNAMRVR